MTQYEVTLSSLLGVDCHPVIFIGSSTLILMLTDIYVISNTQNYSSLADEGLIIITKYFVKFLFQFFLTSLLFYFLVDSESWPLALHNELKYLFLM